MSGIDKRNKLLEEPFTYILTKKATIIIYFNQKQIMVVKDKQAERLIKKIKNCEHSILEVQLLLAKITGNFKHGNEKHSK
ncbi:hypothetical protein [Bacillus sp. mrc49]|uniref:hypothetical protein n=1 Tax=Bacillus sp. mrc49 TaxID=2054913 RepID=UPI000C27E02C|nr:hypothetical protein [Bacillus sp. mrc49]PJN91654.1 hypothetical protein CVN76_03770 [Bacillus sp. mrc49]